MLEKIAIKFGSAPGEIPLEVSVAPITVIVGPNNSGKSKFLKEVYNFLKNGKYSENSVILKEAILENLSETKFEEILKKLKKEPGSDVEVPVGNIFIGDYTDSRNIHKKNLTDFIELINEPTGRERFCSWVLRFLTLMLDGESRMSLTNNQNGGDLQKKPNNSLSALFSDDSKRLEVRRIIYDAFGLYFVIDPTELGKLKVRFSEKPPKNSMEERGVHQTAVDFHSKAKLIDELSDGVRAFTGTVIELIAGDPDLLLIDEPEAFLHPSLSYKLGKEISLITSNESKKVFISTHSPNFIMGCIQSGIPTNIIRLTYTNSIGTARLLPNDKLLKLMRNPLLRSTGVLEGLFYEVVVVTESDADRAFYQEINDRLLQYKPELGIPNCLFINAQNKQTVHQIIKPLRELGISAVGIVDVDILKEGGTVWKNFLQGGFVPSISIDSLSGLRGSIKKKFNDLSIDMKRSGGIEALPDSDQEAANNLFNQLEEYGLFTVKNGELESWLKGLGATGHGPKWLINIFEKMGEDPTKDDYLMPANDDVWNFLGRIKSWAISPLKKGIPL